MPPTLAPFFLNLLTMELKMPYDTPEEAAAEAIKIADEQDLFYSEVQITGNEDGTYSPIYTVPEEPVFFNEESYEKGK